MKILLVNYEYKPQCGGAGLGTYNMAYQLAKMGHEVKILIGWDYSFGTPEQIEGVEMTVVRLKKKNIHQSTSFGMIEFLARGFFEIKRLTKENSFDIIQFYFSVPTGILKYGIHGKIPYVVSLRGMDIPGFRNDKYRFVSFMTRGINRLVVKNAAAVTCLSGEAANYYKVFSPNTDITVIPNAVDYEVYKVKRCYSETVRKFVAVSRLTGFKNLDLMIKAFCRVYDTYKDVSLDIYGEGKEREILEKLISENGANEYIKLKGYADRDTLIEVLPQYDVFSLTSVGDSFGIVYIEAMSAALPVLCAGAGGPIEIVENGKTGIIAKPNDLEDTIRCIEYCINNPDLMEEYGKNGRKRVEELYSREAVAKQHLQLYQGII